jgi:ribonuclease P protein component
MLPAAHRLRSAADFQDVIRRGVKASRGAVVVYVLAADERDPSQAIRPARVGTVVSKKVGGSVTRHRAARRIRGAAAPLLKDLPTGCRVVIRARPGADTDPSLAVDLRTAITLGVERSPQVSRGSR